MMRHEQRSMPVDGVRVYLSHAKYVGGHEEGTGRGGRLVAGLTFNDSDVVLCLFRHA